MALVRLFHSSDSMAGLHKVSSFEFRRCRTGDSANS